MKLFLRVVVMLFVFFVVSCGGGGGGGSHKSNPTPDQGKENDPNEQYSFYFENKGAVELFVGDTYQNKLTIENVTAIEYSSSDETVASVGSDGLLQVTSPGTATISAEGITQFDSSVVSDHYEVHVIDSNFRLNAWVGFNDSILTFSPGVNGLEFYTTSQKDCDYSSYWMCENGQKFVVNDQPIIDTSLLVVNDLPTRAFDEQTAYYRFNHAGTAIDTVFTNDRFPPGRLVNVLTFDQKMWLFKQGELYGQIDVWSSADGNTWEKAGIVETDSFSAQALVYNDAMHVLDRYGGVRSSTDGATWTIQPKGTTLPQNMLYSRKIVYRGKVWAFGEAYASYSYSNAAWYTENLKDWYEATPDSGLPLREAYGLIVKNNTLWRIAGCKGFFNGSPSQCFNDVWKSDDGIHWTEVVENAPFAERSIPTILANDLGVWVIGGRDELGTSSNGTDLGDSWFSADGVNWTLKSDSTPFLLSSRHRTTHFDGKMWIFTQATINDIWKSDTGENWEKVVNGAAVDQTGSRYVVNFKDELLLILPSRYEPARIWRSSNGVDWRLTNRGPKELPYEHVGVFIFKQKIWMLGYHPYAGGYAVWSTEDGYDWKKENTDIPFDELVDRNFQQNIVQFEEKMWLFDRTFSEMVGSIWNSDDGIHWVKVVERTPMADVSRFSIIVFNNKLYFIGGSFPGFQNYSLKIWSSENGIDWDSKVDVAPYGERDYPTLVVFSNELWIFGHSDDNEESSYVDAWKTNDGENWEWVTNNVPKQPYSVTAFKDTLWIVSPSLFRNFSPSMNLWKSEDGSEWRHLFSRSLEFKRNPGN